MTDSAIAAGLMTLCLVEIIRDWGIPIGTYGRPADGLAVVLTVGQFVLVPWRRRIPLEAFTVALSLLLISKVLDYPPTGGDGLAMLVGLYAVGAYRRGPDRSNTAIGVIAAPAVAAVLNYPNYLVATNVIGLSVISFTVFMVGRAVRRNRLDVASARDEAARVKAQREEGIRRAVAEERNHIARELHDVVAHSLGFIAFEAEAGRRVFDRDPARALEALETVGATGRQGLAEMRRLLLMLRQEDGAATGQAGPQAPQPTLGDLPGLVDGVRQAGMPVELHLDMGRHAALPPGVQLSAYRIVQEALNNTTKHARGATARVDVRDTDAGLRIEVVDTGNPVVVPFPRPAPDGHVAHGIIGMRERAALFGGHLEAGPVPGGGWRVAAVLPLRYEEAAA